MWHLSQDVRCPSLLQYFPLQCGFACIAIISQRQQQCIVFHTFLSQTYLTFDAHCCHMATVGVKGLLIILWSSRWLVDPQCQRRSNVSLCSNTWAVSKHSVGLSRFLAGLCLGRQTSRSRVGLNQLFVVALSHWVDDWNDEIDDHHHYDFLKQPRQPACLLKPTGNCVINDVIKAASIVPTETVSTGRRKWYPLAGANVCGRHTPWLAD